MSVTNFEIFEVFVYALILVWLNMVLLILLLHSDWDSLKISLIEQIFMSVVITVQLPDFTAQWLEELTQDSGLSKTDLIVQGLESIFASRLDQKFMYLGDKQLDHRFKNEVQLMGRRSKANSEVWVKDFEAQRRRPLLTAKKT